MNEIIKADPRRQRLVLLALTLGAALGVWSMLHLEHQLSEARSMSVKSVRQAAEQTLEIASTYFRVLGAVVTLFGLYLILLARRIWVHARFPPPGFRVVRDTRLRVGSPARLRSVLAAVIGLALVAVGALLPVWSEGQLEHVLKGALQTPDTPPDVFLPHVE